MALLFLSDRGFSIGIGDVQPRSKLLREKAYLLDEGNDADALSLRPSSKPLIFRLPEMQRVH